MSELIDLSGPEWMDESKFPSLVETLGGDSEKSANDLIPNAICECGKQQAFNEVTKKFCGCCDECMPF